jgi:DNA-binding IclR family transcriptional regulator
VGVIIPTLAPVAAISVAAISSRLDPTRRLEIAAQLQVQALRLSRLLDRLDAGVANDRTPAR